MSKKKTMDQNFGEAVRSLELAVYRGVYWESTILKGHDVYRSVENALYGFVWVSVSIAVTEAVTEALSGVRGTPKGPLPPALLDFLQEVVSDAPQ